MYEQLKTEAFARRLRRREKQAVRTLCEEFRVPLYRIVNALIHDAEKTADIVQETFLRVIQNIDQLQHREKLDYWIFRIAVNRAIDSLKEEKKRFAQIKNPDEISAGQTAAEPSPYSDGHFLKNYLAVLQNIRRLPVHQATVFHLKYVENYKEAEISKILEIPLGTVKSRLCLARRRLRALLRCD